MSDIIDAIDGALDDWPTSNDAMRWSPEQGEDEQPRVSNPPILPAMFSNQIMRDNPLVYWPLGVPDTPVADG